MHAFVVCVCVWCMRVFCVRVLCVHACVMKWAYPYVFVSTPGSWCFERRINDKPSLNCSGTEKKERGWGWGTEGGGGGSGGCLHIHAVATEQTATFCLYSPLPVPLRTVCCYTQIIKLSSMLYLYAFMLCIIMLWHLEPWIMYYYCYMHYNMNTTQYTQIQHYHWLAFNIDL